MVVGGDEFVVAPGDVVIQGTLTAQGDTEACVLPEVTVSATGDATVSDIVISTEITKDCQLVVASIDKTSSGNSNAVMAATRYHGGAWAEHKDCRGFVLTRAYTDMKYYDGGNSVWGGHNLLGFRETPTKDGWYVDWCSYDWNPGGSSSVSWWTIGEFAFWEGSLSRARWDLLRVTRRGLVTLPRLLGFLRTWSEAQPRWKTLGRLR